jgi:hypothetical protein
VGFREEGVNNLSNGAKVASQLANFLPVFTSIVYGIYIDPADRTDSSEVLELPNSKPKALVFLARPGLDRGY